MVASGEADSIQTPDGEAAYRECGEGHHHHLICRHCHVAVELWDGPMETWSAKVCAEYGFSDPEHQFEIFATCPDCAQQPRS